MSEIELKDFDPVKVALFQCIHMWGGVHFQISGKFWVSPSFFFLPGPIKSLLCRSVASQLGICGKLIKFLPHLIISHLQEPHFIFLSIDPVQQRNAEEEYIAV